MMNMAPLRGVRRADAAVVGGGWTGLMTASGLTRAGLRVILVTDGQALPPPVATLHQPERFARIAAVHGPEALRTHVAQLRQAMAHLPQPMRQAEVYAFARTAEGAQQLAAQQEALAWLGAWCEPAPDAGGCPFPVARSLRSQGLLGDAEALSEALVGIIRDGGGSVLAARAMNANAGQVFADGGRVDAPQVLLCTGKPLGLAGRRNLALLETRTAAFSQLDAPVPLHTVQAAADGALLLTPTAGGAMALWDCGRTGTRAEAQGAAAFGRFLRAAMPEWPGDVVRFRLHVRSLDGLPIVGQFRAEGGFVLCAAGAEDFLAAALAAQTLCRLALHRPIAADLALRPDRQIPRAAMRALHRRMRKARAVAAMHLSAPRCSHCRCRLRWMRAGRWWGCAGCGSAFGALGQRIAGPALFDGEIAISQRPSW